MRLVLLSEEELALESAGRVNVMDVEEEFENEAVVLSVATRAGLLTTGRYQSRC
jgi:hypothetical protein